MATITGTTNADYLSGTTDADTIFGLAGADTIDARGGNDVVNGDDGDDELFGGTGNDSLYGGVGNDQLTGNAGNDWLYGDDGIDRVRYDGVSANLTITFQSYTGTVSFAGDPGNDDRLFYIEQLTSGNGNDRITISTSVREPRTVWGGGGADTLIGGLGMDVLHGDEGNDQIFGGAGNDSLSADRGSDTLDGGMGFDVALYEDTLGSVVVDLAAGTGTVNDGTPGADSLVLIEGVYSWASNDTLLGNGEANDLRSRGGNDLLNGRAGNDTLDGGPGRDTLLGGSGSDTARYTSHTVRMVIDLVTGTAHAVGTSIHTDRLVGIENAVGGSGADRLIGSSIGQSLDGGKGNDTLGGGAGSDTLTGDLGNDLVQGGKGNDYINGARVLIPSAGADEPEEAFFAALVDDGRDTLDGGTGTDTLFTPSATYYDHNYVRAIGMLDVAIDLVAGTLSTNLEDSLTDTLLSFENVETGNGNDTVIGTHEANLISVGDGANLVRAGAGDDTVIGGLYYPEDEGTWQDQIYGEAGNDRLVGNGSLETSGTDGPRPYGRDYLDGGAGNDTLIGGTRETVMVGGSGADRFKSSNDGVAMADYINDPVALVRNERPRILDFDHDDGDKIVINIAVNTYDSTPEFVGQVASLNDLDEFEFGYVRVGDDLLARFVTEDSEDAVDEDDLEIRLVDYSEGLVASDVLFV